MPQEGKGTLEEWRQYPVFTELLTDHNRYAELRQRCLKSCEELDKLVREGSPEQKEAAQKSLNAYGYALGLLDKAIEERDKLLKEQGG
jgi:hypothetical protein